MRRLHPLLLLPRREQSKKLALGLAVHGDFSVQQWSGIDPPMLVVSMLESEMMEIVHSSYGNPKRGGCLPTRCVGPRTNGLRTGPSFYGVQGSFNGIFPERVYNSALSKCRHTEQEFYASKVSHAAPEVPEGILRQYFKPLEQMGTTSCKNIFCQRRPAGLGRM